MFGLMQERPLLIASIIQHAARHHGEPRWCRGCSTVAIHRTTYAALEAAPDASRGRCSGSACSRRTGSRRWPGTVSATGAVLRHLRHGRDLPHRQPAPVGRRRCLHLNDAQDRLLFADTQLHRADRGRSAEARRASARRGHAVPAGRDAGARAAAGHRAAVLRDADGRGRRRLRLAEFRRTDRGESLLHLRHHRAAEGRAVQPPLHRAARDGAELRRGVRPARPATG